MRFLIQRPLPDEFVSSIWTRWCRAAHLPITRLTQAVLQRKHAPGFFQAGHLEQLAEIFGMPLTTVVQNHTVFPYAVAFYRPEPHSQAVRTVGRNGVDAIGLGAVTQTVSDAVFWRRFCPDCAKVDARKYGLSYWHRIHNLPGVVVCRVHQRPLQSTMLPARGRRTWSGILPHEVRESSPAAPRVTRTLLDVANWSAHILQRDYMQRIESSPQQYRARLLESGALSACRDVCSEKLVGWAQRELRHELAWLLSNERDRNLSWLPLMFRPRVGTEMAAIKHVIATKLVELASKLPAGSLDYVPSGMSARSVTEEDRVAAQHLRELAASRSQAGLKLGVQEALEHIGIWSQYRHDRTRYTDLDKAVRELRRSSTAARRARRRHGRS